MSLEILQSIERAESQAEQVRGDAQRAARDMLKSVEAACVAHERAAAIEHRGLYQQLMEQNRVSVEGELAKKSRLRWPKNAPPCAGMRKHGWIRRQPRSSEKDRASWPCVEMKRIELLAVRQDQRKTPQSL